MKNCSDKFDRIAGTYLAQRHLFQMEDSLNQIVSLTGSLSGKDVTDLGCGGGKPVCDFFAANGARVTGIDYSPEMLREAKKNHPDISFVERDVLDWNPQPESCDLVSCVYMLFCLSMDDQYSLLKTVYDSLRPGGLFYFCTLSPFDADRQDFSGELNFLGEDFLMAYTSPETYQSFLLDTGFKVLESEPKSINGETMHWWIVKK